MNQERIYTLIQKYSDKTATAAEKEELLKWYREKAYHDAEFPGSEDTVGDMMLDRLQREIKPGVKGGAYSKWLLAASILLVAGITYWLFTKTFESFNKPPASIAQVENIHPGSNKATLILADGSRLSLTDAGNGRIAKQSGVQIAKTANGQLVYTIKEPTGTTPISSAGGSVVLYNTIETPQGGQYQVILPDGSKVWLNAFSSLKFPVSFLSQKERRVELSGEAYFEVEHRKDLPFRVVTNKQVVEVLGTHFDINAYPDETLTRTVLLQGAVKLTAGNNTAVLKPGQQADLQRDIKVTYVNAEDAVAWKNGYFKFDDEKLEAIMGSVARWYDVKVIFLDENLKNEKFGVVTTRFASITSLLRMIEQTGDARFSMQGSTITVSRKVK
ncbi:MAG: hypothetical protein JWR38_4157 [Mucilaginibacter sp.]|nr:hypothetical protein [Mucilaginibacter sp.]